MSEEGGFGIGLAEKFFGLIIFVVGLLVLYYTVTSASTLGAFTGFFSFLCVVLVVVGLVLMIAKTTE
ncbi:MAG: hypothetical protein ABSB28_09785 [Candidatus Bathyarchaeia archaeon]